MERHKHPVSFFYSGAYNKAPPIEITAFGVGENGLVSLTVGGEKKQTSRFGYPDQFPDLMVLVLSSSPFLFREWRKAHKFSLYGILPQFFLQAIIRVPIRGVWWCSRA